MSRKIPKAAPRYCKPYHLSIPLQINLRDAKELVKNDIIHCIKGAVALHLGHRSIQDFNRERAHDVWVKASAHLVNRFDRDNLPLRPPDHLGRVDGFGNFHLRLPEHHVYIDDRNFFSSYIWGKRLTSERESRIEAFSKHPSVCSLDIEHVKEVF